MEVVILLFTNSDYHGSSDGHSLIWLKKESATEHGNVFGILCFRLSLILLFCILWSVSIWISNLQKAGGD